MSWGWWIREYAEYTAHPNMEPFARTRTGDKLSGISNFSLISVRVGNRLG